MSDFSFSGKTLTEAGNQGFLDGSEKKVNSKNGKVFVEK
jgi:hypothetical protein